MARGRVSYDYSKDSCDPAPRVPRLRTAPKTAHRLSNGLSEVQSSTEPTQKPHRHNLDDADTSLCSEQSEEAVFDEPPEFLKPGDPVLPTVSCGSVGWSHTRRARFGQRSTPWPDLSGSSPGPWFCPRLTSVVVLFTTSWILERTHRRF